MHVQLAEVDSLLVAEENDSAYHLLQSINENSISDDGDRAYYGLLWTQASHLADKPLKSDSLLDAAINYYQQRKDKEKLANAYYYKSIGLNNKKEYEKSIKLLKGAEALAKQTDDTRLKYKIEENLSWANCRVGQYALALTHAKKALRICEGIDSKRWQADALLRIGIAFSFLEHYDSASLFFAKTEPYINDVPDKRKSYYLTNLGIVYLEAQPQKAKELFQKALSYGELIIPLEHLAEFAYDEGDKEKAYSLWKRALKVNDLTPKDNIIHNLLEYDIEHGRTDLVCERVNEIIAIKDSIISQMKNDTIKDLQMRFDHEVEMNAVNRQLIHWQRLIGVAGFLILCLIGFILWNRNRIRIKLKDRQLQIEGYIRQVNELDRQKSEADAQLDTLKKNQEENTAQILELEKAKENAEKEIAGLNEIMKKLAGQEIHRIGRGLLLYDDLVNNKKANLWVNEDYESIIAYYDAVNHTLVKKWQRQYHNPTRRSLLYLILKDMKKEKEEICHIMAITKDSLRSIEFRLRERM